MRSGWEELRETVTLCGPQGMAEESPRRSRERPLVAGGHGGGGTPGPIPNPEVKPPSADGTAVQSVGEQDAAGHKGALFCAGAVGPLGRRLFFLSWANFSRLYFVTLIVLPLEACVGGLPRQENSCGAR